MARQVFCLNKATGCNYIFNSDSEYQAHKKSGHSTVGQIITDPNETLPIGIPADALPDPEFIARVQALEEKEQKELREQPPTTTGGEERKKLPESLPIVLHYTYSGECPEHRTMVETLEVDVADKHFCIAYCNAGKHQLKSKEVAKL